VLGGKGGEVIKGGGAFIGGGLFFLNFGVKGGA